MRTAPTPPPVPPADFLAVSEVMARYAAGVDTKNWTLFESCWTKDCEATFSGLTYRGRTDLVHNLEVMHAGLDGSLHRFGNVVFTSFEDHSAQTTSYVHAVMIASSHPDGPDFHMYGFYEDDWVRHRGAWLLARRNFSTVWSCGNPRVLTLDTASITALRST